MKRKILVKTKEGGLYSYGYRIVQYLSNGTKIKQLGRIIDFKYSGLSKHFATRRLFRAEITGLYSLQDNSMIAIAKKGLFKKSPENGDFHKIFSISRGSKPLNLCFLPNSHIFFGEYFQNIGKLAVNIYGSNDNGVTWGIVYTFSGGSINHIHGLFYDYYTNRMWVLTGDRENECIIGYTEDEFKTFHVVLRGGQEYRSCQLFFYKDFIVYATDSQYIMNEIKSINRETLEITSLVNIQGSAIKGGQTGDVSYLATTIEPSQLNKNQYSHIWVTKDGKNWKDVYKAKKDCWPAIFQFGTFEFPQKAYCDGKLWFSGRALKGHDGKTSCIEL